MDECLNDEVGRCRCAGLAIIRSTVLVREAGRQAVTSGSFFVLVIGVNVAILVFGLIWTKHQVNNVAAERKAQYRGLFKLEPLPPAGEEVQILVDDDRGMVAELDAVHWPHLGWTDARTLLHVDDDVLGWRWHPFRERPERPEENPATWSREKLAAELKRQFGDHEADRRT